MSRRTTKAVSTVVTVLLLVVQRGEQAGQALHRLAVDDEEGGDALAHALAGLAGHGGGELVLAHHRAHLGRRDAEQLGGLVPGQPRVDEGDEVLLGKGDVAHGAIFPQPAHEEAVGITPAWPPGV